MDPKRLHAVTSSPSFDTQCFHDLDVCLFFYSIYQNNYFDLENQMLLFDLQLI